jgi:hypothetical protein
VHLAAGVGSEKDGLGNAVVVDAVAAEEGEHGSRIRHRPLSGIEKPC